MSSQHVNVISYDDVENLTRFTDESFVAYCNAKLAGCDKHIDFIKKKIIGKDWTGNVVEIGSGNSKLLYRLEQEGLLNTGTGYEISSSRYRFAEKFKDYVKSKNVTNKNNDFLTDRQTDRQVDLIIAVDIVFQLITPIKKQFENELLKKIYNMLKPGGFLLLELWDFKNYLKLIELSQGGVYKYWEEFPASDPFRYGLYKVKLDSIKNIVWEKEYLKRDTYQKSGFINILKPYSKNQIRDILKSSRFNNIKIFNYWSDNEDSVAGEYVVIAVK